MTKDEAAKWFEEFWKTFPRRIGKFAARTAFDKALRGADAHEIVEGAKKYAAWLKQPGWRPQPKHPTTWLNAGCWLDEFEEPKSEVRMSDSVGAFLARWEYNNSKRN